MAVPNRISAVIPPATQAKVIDLLTQAQNELKPYMVDILSKEEENSLAKLGEKSEPFVEKGVDFTFSNPQFVPSWVFPVEAKNDFELFNDLRPIELLVLQIGGAVSSTRTVGGAEALAAINDFYKSVRAAHKAGIAAATPIYEELRKRYVDNGKRKKKAEINPA